MNEDSPVLAKLVRGLPPRPPPKALPNAEPNPFAPEGLTLPKGDAAEPAPPKLRVGVREGATAELEGDRAPNGDAADADPPNTLPFFESPNAPNGEALELANLANPELAKAVDDVSFLSFAKGCDVAGVASVVAPSALFVSAAVVGGACRRSGQYAGFSRKRDKE